MEISGATKVGSSVPRWPTSGGEVGDVFRKEWSMECQPSGTPSGRHTQQDLSHSLLFGAFKLTDISFPAVVSGLLSPIVLQCPQSIGSRSPSRYQIPQMLKFLI